jgi:WD40 repeat protein
MPLGKGLYFTSCLTQCIFASLDCILTAGTDGHAVIWPLLIEDAITSTVPLTWQEPIRIHQSSSKAMDVHCLDDSTKLIASGGDDGSLAVLLTRPTSLPNTAYASAPVLVSRIHASAVTACAVLAHNGTTFILTSGNDQWIRLWKVQIGDAEDDVTLTAVKDEQPTISVHRAGKIKTNVADVSSMAVLEEKGMHARVLICGVGMEVVRLEWEGDMPA